MRAHRDVLKKKTILARIMNVPDIISGEYAENEIRKNFTPSERVAIAKAIEQKLGNRRGQRMDRRHVQKIAHVEKGSKTRDVAASRAGFTNHETYRQAAKVVTNGSAKLIRAMDDGRVSISAASILADANEIEQNSILDLDERAILRAAKEIRQRKTHDRNQSQIRSENRARANSNGRTTWKITADQKVVKCGFLLVDPPYGITDEPWEPTDLEGFTRRWCRKWAECNANFIAIFWSQEKLWQGRQWFDQSLDGYSFQQMLIWHISNTGKPQTRKCLKQSWEPIFLYRRIGVARQIISSNKNWSSDLHNLDCFVAPIPQTVYTGEDLKQHPCQKPVSVMRWLIHALTETEEMVVSPFCGVAPCGIAATQSGRKFLGIETDAKYRRIAERRIALYGNDLKDE